MKKEKKEKKEKKRKRAKRAKKRKPREKPQKLKQLKRELKSWQNTLEKVVVILIQDSIWDAQPENQDLKEQSILAQQDLCVEGLVQEVEEAEHSAKQAISLDLYWILSLLKSYLKLK